MLIRGDDLWEILQENVNPYHYGKIAGNCWACDAYMPGLGAQINSDGRRQVKAYCARCHSQLTSVLKIPRSLRERVPVIGHSMNARPCEVRGCDSLYSQDHHILPVSIDSEWAWRYPTVCLCEHHHRLWHQMTGLATGGSND